MSFALVMKLVRPRERFGRLKQLLRLRRIYRKYRDVTMISEEVFIANLELVRAALQKPELATGAIVECGTWKGGMSAALMEIGGARRDYHFFDSFQGLPPARDIDGPDALAWQRDTESADFHDNCSATIEEFEQTISKAGVPKERITIHAGFFEQSMPKADVPPIAILRLDADWYDSTMTCFEWLFDKVLPGGLILIDDYYTWDGCSRAVHDFLSRRRATERIRSAGGSLAYLLKEGPSALAR